LRFQPALALLVCEALGGDFHPALPVAAAVELVYNFTLVHGEVQAGRVDAQDRPSIWWVWGPAQAINAGDGLHALGRAAIMRLSQRNVPADRVLKAVETLDRACLALCEGQFQDLTFRDQLMVTTHDYYDMIQRKSGALAAPPGWARWCRVRKKTSGGSSRKPGPSWVWPGKFPRTLLISGDSRAMA
jgi:geranylgeranyl diphosphate synthase type I